MKKVLISSAVLMLCVSILALGQNTGANQNNRAQAKADAERQIAEQQIQLVRQIQQQIQDFQAQVEKFKEQSSQLSAQAPLSPSHNGGVSVESLDRQLRDLEQQIKELNQQLKRQGRKR